jgi:hypothetical protein
MLPGCGETSGPTQEQTMICRRTLTAISALLFAIMAQAQVMAQAPTIPTPPPPLPLLFKETWLETPAAVPLSQAVVTNPELILTVYGEAPEVNSTSNIPHIWTGLCFPACAATLKMQDHYADLSGKARVRWISRTSGFHAIRPVVRLADGTLLVGDYADANTYDYRTVEFYLAEVRWMVLDPESLTTKGFLLPEVDLSKVDEFGFADLTPGSGHGFGGFSNVGWIEVYGRPVPRN